LAIGAFIQGFLVFHFPPTSAIIADSLSRENRGVGMATMNTMSSLLTMFSPYIAGMVLIRYGTSFGMRILYALVVCVSVTVGVISIRFLKEDKKSTLQMEPRVNLWGILKNTYSGIPSMLRQLPRTTKALGVLIIFCFMGNALSNPFWVVYVVEDIGLSSVEWGIILLIESAIRTLLYIPAGLLVDRYGRTKFLMGGLGLLLVSIALFIFSKSFLDVLIIRSAVAIVNVFFSPATSALMADTVPREIRGKVMAAFGRGSMMVAGTGGGIGGPGMGFFITLPAMLASILGGMIYDINPKYTWYVMIAAILASLLVSVMYIRDPSDAEI
jgi:MFS family permease